MKYNYKLGIIGAGFMSNAIIKGVIGSKKLRSNEIIVSDINEDSLSKLSKIGVNTTTDNLFLCKNSEFVLLAIKPQTFKAIKESFIGIDNKKIISIMAGVTINSIKSSFSNSLVCRCMPNTPCSIGYGAIGVDLNDFSNKVDKEFVLGILSSLACVEQVKEKNLNIVTGISGSSPAYFYLFSKCMIDYAVKKGIKEDVAKNLVASTMVGSGKMILNNPDKKIEDLINAVCSKGGTTIEAVNTFCDMGLDDIVTKALDSCINRAKELEENS